jgi:hypothetical protein
VVLKYNYGDEAIRVRNRSLNNSTSRFPIARDDAQKESDRTPSI